MPAWIRLIGLTTLRDPAGVKYESDSNEVTELTNNGLPGVDSSAIGWQGITTV